MKPPELPSGVTVPELYALAERAHKLGTMEITCKECGAGVNLDECIIQYVVHPDLAAFLKQIAEFYDQRR